MNSHERERLSVRRLRQRAQIEAHMKRVERECLKVHRWMLAFALVQCALPILFVVTLYEMEAKFHLFQAFCFGVLVAVAVQAVRKYEYSRLLYRKVRDRDL